MLRKIKSTILVAHLGALLFIFSTACKKMNPLEETTQETSISSNPTQSRAATPIPTDLLAAFPAASWMSKVPDKVKISHLSIPGTRNSLCVQALPIIIGPGEPMPLLSPVQVAYQTMDVVDQFRKFGVRYLNVVTYLHSDGWIYAVTAGQAYRFDLFIELLKYLLIDHPKETIVLEVEEYGPLANSAWGTKVKDILAGRQAYIFQWADVFKMQTSHSIDYRIDWPSMEELRGKMMVLSHSTKLSGAKGVRVIGDGRINIAKSLNGVQLYAGMYRQFSNTSGDAKYTDVYHALYSSDNDEETIRTLFINQTGRDVSNTAAATNEASYINPKVEDVFETQYDENPNTGRFGIVAMHNATQYLSNLIYLTNFNRFLKIFKQKAIGNVTNHPYNYLTYAPDGSIISRLHYSYPSGLYNKNLPVFSVAHDGNADDEGTGQYIFPDLSLYPPHKWMSKLPLTTRLNDINIPGTHDAASYYTIPVAQTQNWDIPTQLAKGIRCLDLRLQLSYDKTKLVLHHGVAVYSQTFDDVLQKIIDFLNQNGAANATETVIIDVAISGEGNDLRTAEQFFTEKVIAKKEYFWKNNIKGSSWPTMESLKGKIFLLFRWGLYSDYRPSVDSDWWGIGVSTDPPPINNAASFKIYHNISKDSRDTWYAYQEGHYTGYSLEDKALFSVINFYRAKVWDAGWLFLTGTDLATGDDMLVTDPKANAVIIHPLVKNYLENEFSVASKMGRIGIVSMDYADDYFTKLVYLSNFRREDLFP